jgi:hypothetical protein
MTLAGQLGSPGPEVMALAELSLVAWYAGDHGRAVQLARQAEQITADIASLG